MKEAVLNYLKKFWFVTLVGCVFVAFAIYFAWDTNKDKIPGKSVSGQDVIFALDDYYYTADEYYESLFNEADDETTNGIVTLYALIQKTVADSIDSTDELEETAASYYESYIESWEYYYGDDAETYLEAYIGVQLVAMGYENGIADLEQYYLDQLKILEICEDYILDNTELFEEVYESEDLKALSHILIDDDDDAEEIMAEIDERLADGESFEDLAAEYSTDSSADDGGYIGVYAYDDLVDEFAEAAWALEDGEISEWVLSDYGYHLIRVETSDVEEMLANEDNYDTITDLVLEYFDGLEEQIIWDYAEELGMTFADDDIKAQLMEYLGIESDDEEETDEESEDEEE